MTDYDQVKEISTGMYARRVCGAGIINSLTPRVAYQGDFEFDWVNASEVPIGSDIRQHEAAWDLFWRDLRREWKGYVNSRGARAE